MKKLYVDFKESKNCPNDQLICVFDCQKKRGIPKSPLEYAILFNKRIFDTDEGEFLAIIFALEQSDYINDELEILSDSKPTIDVLKGVGDVSVKAKPYVDDIQKLSLGRKVSFSWISREENMAGFKLEGHPCDKENRDIERKTLNDAKDKDYQRSKYTH